MNDMKKMEYAVWPIPPRKVQGSTIAE